MNRGTIIRPPFEVPAGIAWPSAGEFDDEHNYVERDDAANLYESDQAASDALWEHIEKLDLAADFIHGRRHTPHGSVPFIDRASTEDIRRGEWYADTMSRAEAEWKGLIDACNEAGAPGAYLAQTGGMCLAIQWHFTDEEDGPYVMLAGRDGPLEHTRAGERPRDDDDRQLAVVGFYPSWEAAEDAVYLDIPARIWLVDDDARIAAAAVPWAAEQYAKHTKNEEG